MICKICNEDIQSFKKFISHIHYEHELESKDYYDRYIGGRKLCVYCNKNETTFVSFFKGYKDCCINIQCVNDKIKKTKKEKYGNPNYNNKQAGLESWNIKTQEEKDAVLRKRIRTCVKKYGTVNGGNSPQALEKINRVWNNMTPKEKQENVRKCKKSKLENHDDENWNNREQTEQTNLKRYGDRSYTNIEKMRQTKIERGVWNDPELFSEYEKYVKIINTLTNKVKQKLYESWDGYDYYDREYIKENSPFDPINRPTIDHKNSKFYGFTNSIPPEEIANINNLCITKQVNNSKKNAKTEEQFLIQYK